MAAARRRVTPAQAASLAFLVAPGALFAAGLVVLGERWPIDPAHVAAIAVSGGAATAAGAADWWYHTTGRRVVGPRERRTELVALGADGLPLFALMAAASLVAAPLRLLLPVLLVVGVIAALVVHDETRYHARCTRLETTLHRVLVGGQATAWLVWAHWCFVARVTGA